MKVDLHCHSHISDGTLAPAEVVRRAAANGVALLALTDHDDLGGLAPAQQAAREAGIGLLSGVEISVSWNGMSVHVVGLGVAPGDARLAAGLAGIRAGREARAVRIGAALDALGFRDTLAAARRHAQHAHIVGRAHFARALVEQKAARDVAGVFDHYLVRGKPGYVEHEWAALGDALDWIASAGGVAVLAHPGRYRIGHGAMLRLLEQFKEFGGTAIEVGSGTHTPQQVAQFARLAVRFGLRGSVGSDFHAPGESLTELGAAPRLPEGVAPVWAGLA